MVALWGCQEGTADSRDIDLSSHDHTHFVHARPARTGSASLTFERPEPFEQVGLLIDTTTATTPDFQIRVRGTDGRWTDWRAPEVVWSEGRLHVGRIQLDPAEVDAADALELRGAEEVGDLGLEFLPRRVAPPSVPVRELPFAEPDPVDPSAALRALAPDDMVISRADWGARDPDKICGDEHIPYRMAIHHTVSPADDGDDPAARMRQMQAFHIEGRGWCDIGYHFVVSQSGLIFQGRSTEERTGAHVGTSNRGNIGISLIGNFQENLPGDLQLDAAARIVGWVHRTYEIPLTRDDIKGHREWPDQSTSCPGDHLLAELPTILQRAAVEPAPAPSYDLRVDVRLLDPVHRYGDASSALIPDALPGEQLRAEIVVENASDSVIRGVELGYWLEEPFLEATDYTIETDYPALDGRTWQLNDANDAEENPPHDALGAEGTLALYAFSPGESKRVLVDLSALEYSIGAVDHPDLRAWIRNVDSLYGVQEHFDDPPTQDNPFDELLQAYAEVDILSPHEWQFDGDMPALTEGWFPCSDAVAELSIDPSSGTLGATVGATDAETCVASPLWTRIDADTWDQLVLRLRTDGKPHEIGVSWRPVGLPYTAGRAISFEVEGDDEMQTILIPLGDHEAWAGEVAGLRIAPMTTVSGPEPRPFAIDAIFFQSSSGEVASTREAWIDALPVDIFGLRSAPEPDPEPDPDPDDEQEEKDPEDEKKQEGNDEVRVNDGCATTPSGDADASLLLAALALVAATTRRRR